MYVPKGALLEGNTLKRGEAKPVAQGRTEFCCPTARTGDRRRRQALQDHARGCLLSVQQETRNVTPQYVEGAETLVPYKGRVQEVLQRYLAGLRSSMSYMNARTLEEYRRNAAFIHSR
jgi:IMP dehydrogenase/GMP reductase